MQALQSLMRNEKEPVAFRSRAMAICSLALLRQGNTNQFAKASQVLETTFPAEKGLLTVSIAENFQNCPACEGKGRRETSCPGCKGKTCLRCKGTRVVQTVCSTCMGAKQQFKVSPAVQENYLRLLQEAVEICQQNSRFEKESALALAEKDTLKRIARVESVLVAFPQRTDLEPLKKNLDAAKKMQETELARKKEQARLEQEERDVERLLKLRDAPSAERAAAINEIEMYLLKHPKCSGRSDLEEIKAELTSKEALRTRLTTGAFWLVGLCGGFAFIVFLKSWISSLRVERARPLPGMDRIDKSRFTDPLAVEQEETEARRKQEGK